MYIYIYCIYINYIYLLEGKTKEKIEKREIENPSTHKVDVAGVAQLAA